MTDQEIEEYLEFFKKECPVNFEDFGFESNSGCYEQKVASFDPQICS